MIVRGGGHHSNHSTPYIRYTSIRKLKRKAEANSIKREHFNVNKESEFTA